MDVVVKVVVVARSCFLCQSQCADRGCKLYEAENQVGELVGYDGRDHDK